MTSVSSVRFKLGSKPQGRETDREVDPKVNLISRGQACWETGNRSPRELDKCRGNGVPPSSENKV